MEKKTSLKINSQQTKNKTTLRNHLTPVGQVQIKKSKNSQCKYGYVENGFYPLLVRMLTCSVSLENIGKFLKD